MSLQRELRTQGDFLFKYRSFLPLIILFAGLGVYAYDYHFGKLDLEHSLSRWPIYFGLSLLGLFIRFWAVGYSAENTSGRNTSEGQIADSINTKGPYSLVRHPLYVGNFFMWLGVACITENFWFIIAFICMYWLYYERIMYAEESFMASKFGDAYLDWAAGIPAFVPRFSNYQKNTNTFDFFKIAFKEKAGILNLCLVFFVFEFLFLSLAGSGWEVSKSFWTYPFVISLIYYAIMKLFFKREA